MFGINHKAILYLLINYYIIHDNSNCHIMSLIADIGLKNSSRQNLFLYTKSSQEYITKKAQK